MNDFQLQIAQNASWFWLIIGMVIAWIGFGVGLWLLREEKLSGRFRAALFGLRIASLLLLCLWLVPLLANCRYTRASKPSVLVMVDQSQSMSLGAGDGARPRTEIAKAALADMLGSLRRRFRVEMATFSNTTLQPISSLRDLDKPEGDATDLSAVFQDARRWFSGRPLDAVLLLSDGRITAGGSPKVAAGALGVPVFAAGFNETTRTQSSGDLGIVSVDAPRVCLADNTVRVEITLRATGLDPAKHTVEILEGDRVVAKGEVVFQKDQREARTDLTFVPASAGYHVYTVKATPVAKEQLTRNNESAFAMNVQNARRRVCMIESQWRAEYRYLKRALEEDPNLRFTGFLRVKEGLFKQQVEPTGVSASFPTTLRDFEAYDTLVLGDVNPMTLPAQFTRLLGEYVGELGGGLIVTGGAEVFGPGAARDSDLTALLPVTLGPDTSYQDSKYPLLLSPEGAQHAIFNVGGIDWQKNRALWLSLPELTSVSLFERAKPGAVVLGVHPRLANDFGARIVVAYHQFGKGRVLVLGTDRTWTWALQESRPGFDTLHEQFWRQAVRFVARRPEAGATPEALRASKEMVYEGENVRLTLTVPADVAAKPTLAVTAELAAPDNTKTPIEFVAADTNRTLWEARFKAARTGAYRTTATVAFEGAEPVRHEITVCAQGGSPEFENTAVNNTLLRDLAESTGGRFGYVDELSKLVKAMKLPRPEEEHLFEWNSTTSKLLAGVILALWAAEWMLRKLKNLV